MKNLDEALRFVLPGSMRAGLRKRTFCKWLATEIARITALGPQPVLGDSADILAAERFEAMKQEPVSEDYILRFWKWYDATVKNARSANGKKSWTKDARKDRRRKASIKRAEAIEAEAKKSHHGEVSLDNLTGWKGAKPKPPTPKKRRAD
jgi:hypothetical protein